MATRLALKIDVDTERGTRLGVPALATLFREWSLPACFLYSVGPDNTGKAIRRVFRPGFFKKVSRTSVIQLYGVRTLLNGTLLPAPQIGRRHRDLLRRVASQGFETGIHCYDHFKWQDYVRTMSLEQVRDEFRKALTEFQAIFGFPAQTAGAAGWQASAESKQVYDEARLLYASDTRGSTPFFPRVNGVVFKTLEIPSTLPTFDELMGRPEFPDEKIVGHYLDRLDPNRLNVFTLHAEIEGMGKIELFRQLLSACRERGIKFVRLDEIARELLTDRSSIPICDMAMTEIDGRSGLVATQSNS